MPERDRIRGLPGGPLDDATLERELRLLAAAVRVAAPFELRTFARNVGSVAPAPARARRPGIRLAAAAVAASIVLGLAASAIVVTIRDQQIAASASPSASRGVSTPAPSAVRTGPAQPVDFELGGWGWRRVAAPAPGAASAVADGFLGRCARAGLPVLCTSQDGLAWTTSPDPAVFVPPSGSPSFDGWSIAHAGSAWVATNGATPGIWRSGDGRTWSPVDPGVAGIADARAGASANALYLIVSTVGQSPRIEALTSPDGSTWTKVAVPEGDHPVLAGEIGLTAQGGGDGTVPRLSVLADGSWKRLTLPGELGGLASTIRLPDGSWVGIASAVSGRMGVLVASSDGVDWTAVPGVGTVYSLARGGDRLLAIAQEPNTYLAGLYELRPGAEWRRVASLDGGVPPVTSLISLGSRIGLTDGSRLLAVGAPLPAGTTVPTPSPSPTATPSPSSTGEPFVAGEWRWHRLNVSPGDWVVRLPNGYLGVCGQAMCTSPNGWTWTVPADPAIFATDEAVLVTPFAVARRPGGGNYVLSTAEGAWYSADGVRWRPSGGADIRMPIVLAGPEGFAAIADVPELQGESHLYLSADGTSWTRAPKELDSFFFFQPGGDTSAGVVGGINGKNAYVYSTDGRHWSPVTLPKGAFGWFNPRRLPDGSLIAAPGSDQLIRSTDGRAWSLVDTGAWKTMYGRMAVQGGRVLVQGSADGVGGDLYESTDSAKTFHPVVDGISSLRQLADLAAVDMFGATYVGEPLTEEERSTVTPSPVKPVVAPTPGWTPEPLPTGGISEQEAIRIALAAAHVSGAEAGTVRASVQRQDGYGRWVWAVSTTTWYSSPTAAEGKEIDVDYFTGEVLSIGGWIS